MPIFDTILCCKQVTGDSLSATFERIKPEPKIKFMGFFAIKKVSIVFDAKFTIPSNFSILLETFGATSTFIKLNFFFNSRDNSWHETIE